MRRAAVLVVAVLSLGVFFFPTAATPFLADDVDTIEDVDDLVAVPSDGPGGEYAMLVNTTDGDRKIHLDLSANNGVNPDSVTTVDDVFEIAYLGDDAATVWLTSEVDGVQFYRSANPADSVEHQANNVTLSSNESFEVGVLVDTTGDGEVGGTHSFDIHADVENGDVGAGTGDDDGPGDTDSDDETPSQPDGDDDSATPQPEDDAETGTGPDDADEEPAGPGETEATGDPDPQPIPDEATTAPDQTQDEGEEAAAGDGEEFEFEFGDVLGSSSQEVLVLLSSLAGAMLAGATVSFLARRWLVEQGR